MSKQKSFREYRTGDLLRFSEKSKNCGKLGVVIHTWREEGDCFIAVRGFTPLVNDVGGVVHAVQIREGKHDFIEYINSALDPVGIRSV